MDKNVEKSYVACACSLKGVWGVVQSCVAYVGGRVYMCIQKARRKSTLCHAPMT
jgi:hypothetical protein